MRILFSALLLSLISFSSSGLMSSGKSLVATPDSKTTAANILAKGHPHFPVLKEHGKLFFDFSLLARVRAIKKSGLTPDQPSTPTATPTAAPVQPELNIIPLVGKWQTFVITPDKRRYEGPIIDINSEPTGFRILVEPPILFGTYTIVVHNISVQGQDGVSPFFESLIDEQVQVTNTFNNKIVTFTVQSAELQDFNETDNLPNHSIQGFFIPTPDFISK
jgi:hypothetical protein